MSTNLNRWLAFAVVVSVLAACRHDYGVSAMDRPEHNAPDGPGWTELDAVVVVDRSCSMTTEDDLNAAVGLGALFAEVAEVDPGWTAQIVSATGQPQDSVHCDRTLCGQPSDWYMSIAMMGADGGESGFEAAYSVIREWRPGSGAEFVVIVSDEDEHGAIAPSEFRAWADQRGIRMLAVVGDGDECGEEYPARYLQAAHVAGDLCGTWPSLAMVYP